MKTTHFETFRKAAEFYACGRSYDDACERVKTLIDQGHVTIGKHKTDWSLLGETVASIVVCFFFCFVFNALCAWIQRETNTPLWMFGFFAVVMTITWLWFSVVSAKLYLLDSLRHK